MHLYKYHKMQLTVTGYSTALFSTWFFIEELGILFDAGDGVSSGLLQKSRKIKQVFISHADRDHLGGLFQFNQLNARDGYPIIYYPADCGSFPAIQSFSEKFDPHVKGAIWKPITEKMDIPISRNLSVQSIRNGHVPADANTAKSLSYVIIEKRKKLKEAFKHLQGKEIAQISKEKGKDFIHEESSRKVFGYSGDTPVEDYERWNNTDTLIHEATFLNNDVGLNIKSNKHSCLSDVMKMASEININQLILSHFSSRYKAEEIDNAIKKSCQDYQIKIPVFRVLPGETIRDILQRTPVN